MSIVAISETPGSLGNEIGRRLAESLGYAFADREIIAKAAERFGEDAGELRHGTEEKPSLWERFTDTHQRYKAFVEATLLEMASHDNVVLAGLASFLVLRRVRHALRVRTNAPERERAMRLQQQQGLTPEAAVDIVRQLDRERAARVKFLYHVDVDDPMLYDLVLNTERLTAEQGARILAEALRDERFQTTESSRMDLLDENVVVQARAAFASHPELRARQLFIACRQGHVSLTGGVGTEDERRTAEALLAATPGVRDVQNEIMVAPPTRGRIAGFYS